MNQSNNQTEQPRKRPVNPQYGVENWLTQKGMADSVDQTVILRQFAGNELRKDADKKTLCEYASNNWKVFTKFFFANTHAE